MRVVCVCVEWVREGTVVWKKQSRLWCCRLGQSPPVETGHCFFSEAWWAQGKAKGKGPGDSQQVG